MNAAGSPSPSVIDSITRASAMPSAIAWCMRTRSAQPAPIALEQVDVPQRALAVQRRGDEVGDDLLQGRLVAGRGQRAPVEVQARLERGVVAPDGRPAGQALVDALAEAREALDDALDEDHRARALPVERLVEPQDRVDDHQVGAAVHVQPGRVGG